VGLVSGLRRKTCREGEKIRKTIHSPLDVGGSRD